MKVVMTLLVRDEVDVVESWLAFHLNAGADFVVATDNRSQDGTTEILERYAREGLVHVIQEPGEDLRDGEWVTRMARLAATEFGADWVINSDADEFWWPRGGSLKHVLSAIPERYGTVGAFLRTFVPRPGDGDFAERMTVRFSALAPINDPSSLYRPIRKIVHRADPGVTLVRGHHAVQDTELAPLRGWYPIEAFHFPLRTPEQCARKAFVMGTAFETHIDRASTGLPREDVRGGQVRARSTTTTSRSWSETKELERGLAGGAARRRHPAARRARAPPAVARRRARRQGGPSRCPARRRPRLPAPDARRGGEVRRRSGRARRGGRHPAPAPARRARRTPRLGRAALPERVYRRLARASQRPATRPLGRALDGANADEDLEERGRGVELVLAQVRRGETVEEPGGREHVAVRRDVDVALAERLLGEPSRRTGGVVPPLAPDLVLGR